jgi:outer membrane immunogenic protein
MNAFRVSACALLLASVTAGAVQASDLPSRHQPVMPMMPPMFSWTGFYIGGNLGGVAGTSTSKYYYTTNNGVSKASPFMAGVIGGIQGGYNYQWTDWLVIGAEVDFDWTNASSLGQYYYTSLGTVPAGKRKLKYVGTVRGRLGYSADRALMYITGGYAYSSMKNTYTLSTTNAAGTVLTTTTANKTKPLTGWTIGGGMEYALTNNVLVRTEYLYTAFNKSKYDPFPNPIAALTTNASASLIRAAVNYKF